MRTPLAVAQKLYNYTPDDMSLLLVQIHSQKVKISTGSRIGSLQNIKHKPGGGTKKIFDDKVSFYFSYAIIYFV